MWESFNNTNEQDLVRDVIDYKSEKNLNLDNVTAPEREKALSEVFKQELKDIYSPIMEQNGKSLNPEQLKGKKAVINAIVDIARQPQKIEIEQSLQWPGVEFLSSNLWGNIPNNPLEDTNTFTITPQEIADEIYGEGAIDMINEVELALDQEGWRRGMQISEEFESLEWRMPNWELIEFTIKPNKDEALWSNLDENLKWEYTLNINSNDNNSINNNSLQTLEDKINIPDFTGTREECIREIQMILRNKNEEFTVTWIEDHNHRWVNGTRENMWEINLGDNLNNKWSGFEQNVNYDQFIDEIIPKMSISELKSLLEKVTWDNRDKIDTEHRERIIDAILKNDIILSDMSVLDLMEIKSAHIKIIKELEERLTEISNSDIINIFKKYQYSYSEKKEVVTNNILTRFSNLNSHELLELYTSDWKWYSDIRNRFQEELTDDQENAIITLIKDKEYIPYTADVGKKDIEAWAPRIVTAEEQRRQAIDNFRNYIYEREVDYENLN